jgi:hypothetical protein
VRRPAQRQQQAPAQRDSGGDAPAETDAPAPDAGAEPPAEQDASGAREASLRTFAG